MKLSRRTLITAVSAAAVAQAQRTRVPSWKPMLGVLGQFSDANLEFVKAEGFTSMELRLDPRRLDDAAVAAIKDKIRTAGIYVSSLELGGNHIDPDPARREHPETNTPANDLSWPARWGCPTPAARPAPSRDRRWPAGGRDRQVYTEKYFPLCEKYKVRMLWEPYAGGPNIATGPVGWEALFKAFNDSPHGGSAIRPLTPGVAVHGPGGGGSRIRRQDLRLTSEGHRNSVADRAARRNQPVDNRKLVALPRARLRLGGLERLLRVLSEAGYTGAMNIENEDQFYYPELQRRRFHREVQTRI